MSAQRVNWAHCYVPVEEHQEMPGDLMTPQCWSGSGGQACQSAGRGRWAWRSYHVCVDQERKEVQCRWGTRRDWNWLDEKAWHKEPGCGRGKWEWLERETASGVRRNKMKTCWARIPMRSLRRGLEDGLRQEEREEGTNSTPTLEWNRNPWRKWFLCFYLGEPISRRVLSLPVLVLTLSKTTRWLLWARSVSFPPEVCPWQIWTSQLCWCGHWCDAKVHLFYLQFQKSAQKLLKNITKIANSSSLKFRLLA